MEDKNLDVQSYNDTTDKVYLLSVGEVMNPEYGFNSSSSDYAKSRRGLNTTFAKEQGAQTSTSGESARYGRWWLRPALHLNLSSDPGKAGIGKVSVLKLKQKKGTVTVSWKKTIGAKGYQICYSTSKKWKNKKQKLVTKNKAVIKNLKKKMTCYLRVRAYILEGTKKVYGAWSSVKRLRSRSSGKELRWKINNAGKTIPSVHTVMKTMLWQRGWFLLSAVPDSKKPNQN